VSVTVFILLADQGIFGGFSASPGDPERGVRNLALGSEHGAKSVEPRLSLRVTIANTYRANEVKFMS
jgi:hypothetical protein